MKSFAPLSVARIRRGMNEQVSAWLTAVEGLPAVHARLKRVVILKGNAIDVIQQHDSKTTLTYCDPPYLHATRIGTSEYGEHEMTDAQHAELLNTLMDIDGKFMLSGYRSGLYDRYAAENNWVRHDFDIANHAASGANKRRATECVWCNFSLDKTN